MSTMAKFNRLSVVSAASCFGAFFFLNGTSVTNTQVHAQVTLAEETTTRTRPPERVTPKGGPNLEPRYIEGQAFCVDCHTAEVAHWMAHWQDSEHGWLGYSRLLGKQAEEYGQQLEIEAETITKNSVCIECHATPSLDYRGRTRPILGVACEACHNPSGGAVGWLNIHAVYGPAGTRRLDETAAHYRQRKQRTVEAGQLQSSDVYSLVRRCFDCHIVGDELLITKTDHEIEDRNFSVDQIVDNITNEKIRHNFHLKQSENAEVATLWTAPHPHHEPNGDHAKLVEGRKKMYYVVGMLGRAETILRLLARLDDPMGKYAGDLASLLDIGDLEDVLESVDLSDDERTEVEELLEMLEDMEIEDTAGDVDEDERLNDEEISLLNSLADRIARIGIAIANGDGGDLEEVELP
ncbi:multiheme c-type cytochrome [Pirellulales bacterium]|nr:multiheme c-type cytochrome [Pirellulales bacterium]